MSPAISRADLVLHEEGGWSYFTTGLVGAHYQFIKGDADPITTNLLVGGKLQNNQSQDENNQLAGSRIRSGFVGTHIGFGVTRQITETIQAMSFLAVSLNGIDSFRGKAGVKDVDFRQAYASVTGRFGTASFGRMFSIFGSASGDVVGYAFGHGVGHPCYADQANIACGSVGAGPIYAGYNAQLRYHTPRIAGLQAQVSLEDPSELPAYHITPLPRFEGEINYELNFASDGKLIVKGQGLMQKLSRVISGGAGTESVTAWGGMAVARIEVAGFKIGGGGWTGKGMGTQTPLQQDNLANPQAHDIPGGGFPGGELRLFQGFFGNTLFDYHGSALGVGAGTVQVRQTNSDADASSNISLVKQNLEYHIFFNQRIDVLVLTAEYMHWKSDWHRGETQSLNFFGGGANFVW